MRIANQLPFPPRGVGFQQVHEGFLVTLAKYSRPRTEGSLGHDHGPTRPHARGD